MARTYKDTLVNVNELRTGDCSGRDSQIVSPKHVSELRDILLSGQEFTTKIEATSDLVVFAGLNRTEAYLQYFGKKQVPYDAQVAVIRVWNISYDNGSEADHQWIEARAFATNAEQPSVLPLTAHDLRWRAGVLLEQGYSESDIIKNMHPLSRYRIKQAVDSYRKSKAHTLLSYAIKLRDDGMSEAKAKTSAGLPEDTILPKKGEKKSDRDRLHKVGTTTDATAQSWATMATKRITRYKRDGRGQNDLRQMAQTLKAAASVLSRKADDVEAQVNRAIEERAGRMVRPITA
jgi:hypothetical protein